MHEKIFPGELQLVVHYFMTEGGCNHFYSVRYLEPDPMLLVSAPGSREEKTERNSKFHSLNRAIVQLVRTHLP